MPKNITQYELLISCPSDVKKELSIIEEVIKTFNDFFGGLNNIKIVTKHWSKDSYPQLGGKPQTLLNNQFVSGCDAAVAVFWTRFGTPTDEYGSGTEEEIEELIKNEKQVFLYFSDCPVEPSKIVNEQYELIQAFRKKYQDKGVYGTYSDLEMFKKDFLNHLTLHFINLVVGDDVQKPLVSRSSLVIQGVDEYNNICEMEAYHNNFADCKHVNTLRESINEKINKINEIVLEQIIQFDPPQNTVVNKELNTLFSGKTKIEACSAFELSKTLAPLTGFQKFEPIVLHKMHKDRIIKFAEDNGITLIDSFFDLGMLKESENYSFSLLGQQSRYKGSEQEKDKHEKIINLSTEIEEYEETVGYFSEIDKLAFVKLALCNCGNDYDEDIDVKLYFNKGILCSPEDLPKPQSGSVDICLKSFEYIYKPSETVNIFQYPDYYQSPRLPNIDLHNLNPFMQATDEKIYEDGLEKLEDIIEEVFCYQHFIHNDEEILRYNQKYLKQNTNSYLPSVLVFKEVPNEIRYEISAKHSPNVMRGKLILGNL